MNADYIKSVVDKANELIALIESAAANPKLSGYDANLWKSTQYVAISRVKKAVKYAVEAETLN